jgi:hypothetical protein
VDKPTNVRPVVQPAPPTGPAAAGKPSSRTAPEIVQTPAVDRARAALAAGAPDDAVAVLRPEATRGNTEAKSVLADALVASGWKDVKVYRWAAVSAKAREALALAEPGRSSHGAHALLGEAHYALRDFNAALAEFTKALAESPRDARLKRRVIRSRRQLRGPTAASAAASTTTESAAEE